MYCVIFVVVGSFSHFAAVAMTFVANMTSVLRSSLSPPQHVVFVVVAWPPLLLACLRQPLAVELVRILVLLASAFIVQARSKQSRSAFIVQASSKQPRYPSDPPIIDCNFAGAPSVASRLAACERRKHVTLDLYLSPPPSVPPSLPVLAWPHICSSVLAWPHIC